jgi:hypothetical protein
VHSGQQVRQTVSDNLSSRSPHDSQQRFSFFISLLPYSARQNEKSCGVFPMSEIVNYHAMEILCLQRAKRDPANSGKWVAQAERWQSLTAWRSQQLHKRQQMHAGPMAMGPNTINGDARKLAPL